MNINWQDEMNKLTELEVGCLIDDLMSSEGTPVKYGVITEINVAVVINTKRGMIRADWKSTPEKAENAYRTYKRHVIHDDGIMYYTLNDWSKEIRIIKKVSRGD